MAEMTNIHCISPLRDCPQHPRTSSLNVQFSATWHEVLVKGEGGGLSPFLGNKEIGFRFLGLHDTLILVLCLWRVYCGQQIPNGAF